MKVMCISQDSRNADTDQKLPPLLNIGIIYTVVGTRTYSGNGEIYYELLEIPRPNVFWHSLFAPLSDIDETEFVREQTITSY